MLTPSTISISFVVSIALLLPGTGLASLITGMTVSAPDADGNLGHTWNTLPAGGLGDTHNLWITGEDILGAFINGPSNEQVAISLPLSLGTHSFTIFADQHSVTDFSRPFVLNLFLDGEQVIPRISAVTTSDPAFSPFGGTTVAVTRALVAGADTLEHVVDDTAIRLLAFTWSSPDQLNRVSTYEAFPNGLHRDDGADFIGRFTLQVRAVPEPSSVIVWSLLGMTVTGISWWKRRKRQATPRSCVPGDPRKPFPGWRPRWLRTGGAWDWSYRGWEFQQEQGQRKEIPKAIT